MQYNDYRIVKDIDAKKAILKILADYFEGKKKEFTSNNSRLANNICFAINNFNIRYNNITGPKANEFMKDISDKDLLELYDKVYFMMLMAFRQKELNNIEDEFEELKREKFDKTN